MTTDRSKRSDIVAIRTGRLYEADIVANHFDEEGIPYYRREESSSGVELAMPLMPVQGVGIWWVIRVPQEYSDRAREVIDSLPVEATLNPSIWHYGPSKRVKRFMIISVYISIIFTMIWFILWITRLMSES